CRAIGCDRGRPPELCRAGRGVWAPGNHGDQLPCVGAPRAAASPAGTPGAAVSWVPDRTLEHLRQVTEAPDLAGTRYRVEREIGRGGMGIVYRARDTLLDRAGALKVIEAGPAGEARTMARLQRPRAGAGYDHGVPAGAGG